MSQPFLSIVIPAYNEEARLVRSLQSTRDYLSKQAYQYEVIVVSDGSQDRTAAVAREWCPPDFPLRVIDRRENRGKGYTVREGMRSSRGELVLFSDADLSTPIEEVEKLLPFLRQGCDIVIASRSLKASQIVVPQPWYRGLMGKVFNLLVQTLAVPGIVDTQCGFKLFSRKARESILPLCLIDGFSFDVEMLLIARKLNLRVREVPVRWIDSPHSTLSPIRDALKMFRQLIEVRLNDWKGLYKKPE